MEYTSHIKVMTRSKKLPTLARHEDWDDFKVFILRPTYRSLKHALNPSSIVAVQDEYGITYKCWATVNEKTHPALMCTPYTAGQF